MPDLTPNLKLKKPNWDTDAADIRVFNDNMDIIDEKITDGNEAIQDLGEKKQNKEDSTLKTIAKKIVEAINELFDSKLEKGGYTGNAKNLNDEISKKASKTVLGRMIVGDNLTVDDNGRVSATKTEIVNDLVTGGTEKAGSAEMVKKLKEQVDEKADKTLVRQFPNDKLKFCINVENGKLNWWSSDPTIHPLEIESVQNLGGGAFTSATGKFAGVIDEDGLYIGKTYTNIISGITSAIDGGLTVEDLGEEWKITNKGGTIQGNASVLLNVSLSGITTEDTLYCYFIARYEPTGRQIGNSSGNCPLVALNGQAMSLYGDYAIGGFPSDVSVYNTFKCVSRRVEDYNTHQSFYPFGFNPLTGGEVCYLKKRFMVVKSKHPVPFLPYGIQAPKGSLVINGMDDFSNDKYSLLFKNIMIPTTTQKNFSEEGRKYLFNNENRDSWFVDKDRYFDTYDCLVAKNSYTYVERLRDGKMIGLGVYGTAIKDFYLSSNNPLHIGQFYIYNSLTTDEIKIENSKNIAMPKLLNNYSIPDASNEPDNLCSEIFGLRNGGSLNNYNQKLVNYVYWDYNTHKYYKCIKQNKLNYANTEYYEELTINKVNDIAKEPMFKHYKNDIYNQHSFTFEEGWRFAIVKAGFAVPSYGWNSSGNNNQYLDTQFISLSEDSLTNFSNYDNTLTTFYDASTRKWYASKGESIETGNKIYNIDVLYIK